MKDIELNQRVFFDGEQNHLAKQAQLAKLENGGRRTRSFSATPRNRQERRIVAKLNRKAK